MSAIGVFSGLRVVLDDLAFPQFKEDWSRVRSPGRATRRRKRGFRQNIDIVPNDGPQAIRFGDTIITNSAMYAQLKAASAKP